MIQDVGKIIYSKYGVENISKSEEFVHIARPDKNSAVYKDFEKVVNSKVELAMKWLAERDIEYVWNNWIDRHLYRLYIPSKELIFDFELYPVFTEMYNYIRISYDTDIIEVLESLYPEHIYETNQLQMWVVTQKATNEFLRQNNHSPIYYKNILRLAWVDVSEEDPKIIQLAIIKNNQIIVNITARHCKVNYGTFMLLRYLTEQFDYKEVYIKERLDNSYNHTSYQLYCKRIVDNRSKQKVWWNSSQTKWHIAENESSNYMPFYLSEYVTYCYRELKI